MSHPAANIPMPSIATGGLAPPQGSIYTGSPGMPPLVAMPPPPQMPTPQSGRRQRVSGIVPAHPGANFPLVRRESAGGKVPTQKEVGAARARLRIAAREQQTAEAIWAATASGERPQGDLEKLKAAQAAGERTAMQRRTVADLEGASSGRVARVEMATVREPAEVADRLDADPGVYVCFHEKCAGKTWGDEAEMRRAHDSVASLQRAGECHVFALLVDAPLSEEDPEGERVGYVAPTGSDGTIVQRATGEEKDERADDVGALKSEIADLRAMIAEMMAAKKSGGK